MHPGINIIRLSPKLRKSNPHKKTVCKSIVGMHLFKLTVYTTNASTQKT